MDNEKSILESWQVNAGNWIDLISRNGIESRKIATNQAIIDAVSGWAPQKVLDLGCGEGWLALALSNRGMQVDGVDAIPELITEVRKKLPGNFYIASYEDISKGLIQFPHTYDVIVVNFALIGKESTEDLLKFLPGLLSKNGRLIIQTLHPYIRKETGDYITGWKKGSWDGLGTEFTMPYDWYFRTMEDWVYQFHISGYRQLTISEVTHPQTFKLLSVIFTAQV